MKYVLVFAGVFALIFALAMANAIGDEANDNVPDIDGFEETEGDEYNGTESS